MNGTKLTGAKSGPWASGWWDGGEMSLHNGRKTGAARTVSNDGFRGKGCLFYLYSTSTDNGVGVTTTFSDEIAGDERTKWDLGKMPFAPKYFGGVLCCSHMII